MQLSGTPKPIETYEKEALEHRLDLSALIYQSRAAAVAIGCLQFVHRMDLVSKLNVNDPMVQQRVLRLQHQLIAHGEPANIALTRSFISGYCSWRVSPLF